ncbi:outer membrane protein [Leptospira kirschneri str. 200801925]|uniref:Outer membrane protein n=1 Tax=Leptospira kirschneri str. 200802841 TaxID=1193047 RepID=A0A828XYT0_9LEPT|nr:porin [Leptospira kirschneri]EKO52415.1 outer membrane protein [Leptospira kirschneri str. 200802841]EMO77016.1 outer membrane protein [Leptospira kirschneri str. 200801925]
MTQKRNFQKLECSKRRTQINFGSDFLIKNLLNKFVFQKYIFTILYSCISIFPLSADSQKSDSSTTQTKEKVLNSSHISSTNLQSPTNEKSIDKDSSQIQNDDFQSKDEIEKNDHSKNDSSSKETPEENKQVPKFGFFIDSYYAHNPYCSSSRDNRYLTQPARWDEINVNLAYIDGKIETDQYRGRVAFQFGNSVNSNYKNEVSLEKNSNEISVRNIQEAYAGIKLAKNLWLDGGIYFGNIGLESWISHNNWNYSRALALDYVPYYSSGFRLSFQYSEKLSFQLHLMNGWSNITETNKDKAVGSQIDYKITDKLKITHNTFVGNEAPDSQARQTRYYNNLILQYHFTKHFIIAGSGDVGIQRVPDPGIQAYRQWYHGTFWITWRPVEKFRTSLRLERMFDPEQTIIQTGSKNGFLTSGATITLDYIPNESALVRLEGRYFRSYDAVFDRDRSKSKEEKFIVFAVSVKI